MKHLSKIFTLFLIFAFYCLSSAQERKEIGNLILEDVPEIPDKLKSRINQYQNTRSASLADWLPGGKGILISTRFGNTSQLHTVKIPGGARNQITYFDEPVTNGLFCPSPEFNIFLFTKDIGGNEYSQIFLYDMKTGTSKMVSDGKSRNFGISWSNKGDQFAFTSSRRNQKDFDIYLSPTSDPLEAKLIIDKGSGYWAVQDWSPNDEKLIVNQYLSITKSNSFIYNIKTNSLIQINNPQKESVFITLKWNKTGEKIYIISDEGKEFSTLAEYEVTTKKINYITSDIPWDVKNFAINSDKSKAAFTINENGFRQLYILDTETSEYKKVEGLPAGQINSIKFNPSSTSQLALDMNNPETPGDVYTYELETEKITRWTTSEVGGLNTSEFPKPKLISYETFDEVEGQKRKIPAFVYKPLQGKEPFPVVIYIHGGPESQFIPRFSSFYSFLANELGIAVIAPNVRGSSGYGKDYVKLDNGFKRENSVKDIGKLIEWIEANPEFDEKRIAVYGGSYGGYMVLSSMFHYNDKIKCGIDVVGISNFVTFLENTKAYRRDLRRAEYGDERDPEMRKFLTKISPTTNAEKITIPLFVIQGANDPRVPASESEQMVQVIRKNNGKVWYMLAKDEGHGFKKKENRDRMMEAIALFLKMNLL